MPARLPLTPEQALERIREQGRRRASRYRERRNVTGNVTPPTGATREPAGSVTPPQTPPVFSLSLLERKTIEHVLSTFLDRGYRHDPRFWELLRQRYPLLDLELEVLKLTEWLDEPRNQKRKCSKGFISNWLSKADVDRQQREAQARTLPPTGQNGSTQTPRPSPGKPPDPDPVLPADVVLERIDPAVAQRALLEARRYTLEEKLALAKSLNGRH